MTNATLPIAETTWITDFGPVPFEQLKLAENDYELHLYRLSEDKVKALTDALSFTALFDSPDVYNAYADIQGDEAYISFEVKYNSRPQNVSLRYTADRWSAVDSMSASAARRMQQSNSEQRGMTTIFHAFLDETLLNKLSEHLNIKSDERTDLFIRINFKERNFALAAVSGASNQLPCDAYRTSTIPKIQKREDAMTENEVTENAVVEQKESQNGNVETAEEQPSATNPAVEEKVSSETITTDLPPISVKQENTETAMELLNKPEEFEAPESAEETTFSETKKVEAETAKSERTEEKEGKFENPPVQTFSQPAPIKRTSELPRSEATPKFDPYSRSEVDRLLKNTADTVSNTMMSKIKEQQKAMKETMQNQEYQFNQAMEKLTLHLEEANSKLNNACGEINLNSNKQIDGFKQSLSKELDEFKSQLKKEVLPGIKLLDARLEQLVEVKKGNESPFNPSVVIGFIVAIVILSGVNLLVSYYAFERISNLEKSQAELTTKSSGLNNEVPIPDLMKDQIDKPAVPATPAP